MFKVIRYCQLMHLRAFETCVMKYMNLTLLVFLLCLHLRSEAECHAIYRFVKANNKHMKNYDKNKESSYLQYEDINNLYGCAMYQRLPLGGFKWDKETSQFS